MSALMGLLLSPFVLAFMLWTIRPGVRWIDRALPDSRAKRFLFLYWKN